MFESLLSNEKVMKSLLSKLAGVMKSENLEYILLSVDPEDGGVLIKMCKPGDITVAVNVTDETPEEPKLLTENPDTNENP